MCDLDDGERADAGVVTTPRARKPHTCATCGLTIAVGEVYVRTFVAFDGEGHTERACRACWEVQDEFGRAHGVTPLPSMTRETIEECVRGGVMDLTGPWHTKVTAAERRARVAKAEPSERRWRQLLAGIMGRLRKAEHQRRRVEQAVAS